MRGSIKEKKLIEFEIGIPWSLLAKYFPTYFPKDLLNEYHTIYISGTIDGKTLKVATA